MTKKDKSSEESSVLSELVKKLVLSPDQALQKISSTTSELKQSINSEMKRYLDKIDPSKEIEKILEKYDFEIKATVRLKKKPSKAKSKAPKKSTKNESKK